METGDAAASERVDSSKRRAGFTALYDDHVAEVYRFVHRRCRDHVTAEDVTQDTFLTAVRTIGDPADVTVGWLIEVARNRLLDVVRRRARYVDKLRLIGPADDDIDASTAIVEQMRVQAAFEHLTVEHRLVLTLHYIDGMTTTAIAESLGGHRSPSRAWSPGPGETSNASWSGPMPDDLTRLVAVIEGEGPSTDFVAALRTKIEAELLDEQSPAHVGPDKGDLIVVDIQSKTGTSRESDETRHRWRPYAVLAAAAVVVVIVAVALFDGTEDGSLDFVDAPFTESRALGIVEAYYSAAEAGDADAIAATLAENMIRAGAADLGEVLALLVWDAAQGRDLVDRTCTAGNEESGTFVVVCEYDNYQYLQQVAGAPATSVIDPITVTADGITATAHSYGRPAWPANDAFYFWMRENFPEDASAVACCGEHGSIEEARADGELRRRYADLWAAYLEESDCTYTVWVGC